MSPDYAKEWIRKARADKLAAERALKDAKRNKDQAEIACFHAQQCAEKYLKAVLSMLGLAVPRIHDLLALAPILKKHGFPCAKLEKSFRTLNHFAVEIRYPGFSATVSEAGTALNAMKKVVVLSESFLRKH
ncbi:MAG: HEPN domain-containing protein [Elusimicrobia bacterium]|nr:HEPN domain-containing protein [Elusimicrobiota bacterium]